MTELGKIWGNQDYTCKCGHHRGQHDEEQPYQCCVQINDAEDCECNGFEHATSQEKGGKN